MQLIIVDNFVVAIYTDGCIIDKGIQTNYNYTTVWLPNGFRYKKPITEDNFDISSGKIFSTNRYFIKPGDINPYKNTEYSGIDAYWINKYIRELHSFYCPEIYKLMLAITSGEESAIADANKLLKSVDDTISTLITS